MKRIPLLSLVLALVPAPAGASTPVVGAGGVAVATGDAGTACGAVVRMLLEEVTLDRSPLQVRGRVSVEANSVCAGALPVPYATDIHVWAGKTEIVHITCWTAFSCGSPQVAFALPPGETVSAASHHWWDVPAGRTWNAATPGLCTIKNPRVFCGAYALATP
ncbi:MAG: hypothetical protein HY814_13920 [Candidatus Riflebacteria bacterium]|nr:hypothetical protein [Candidatus Riflebacteria bacterium]